MNNEACKGYVIKACTNLKIDKRTMEKLINSLDRMFDELTEHEAETLYYKG